MKQSRNLATRTGHQIESAHPMIVADSARGALRVDRSSVFKLIKHLDGRVMTALAIPEDDPEYETRAAHGVPGGKTPETV